jgi:hypothetical protein
MAHAIGLTISHHCLTARISRCSPILPRLPSHLFIYLPYGLFFLIYTVFEQGPQRTGIGIRVNAFVGLVAFGSWKPGRRCPAVLIHKRQYVLQAFFIPQSAPPLDSMLDSA